MKSFALDYARNHVFINCLKIKSLTYHLHAKNLCLLLKIGKILQMKTIAAYRENVVRLRLTESF